MLQGLNTRNRHPLWDPDSDFASMESDLGHLEELLQMYIPLRDTVALYRSPEGVIDQANVRHFVFVRALFHLLTACWVNLFC